MVKIEFDIKEPFFKKQQDLYEAECIKQGFNSNTVATWLFYLLQKYGHERNKIELIKRLDFSDKNKVKVLLNKAFFSTKEDELNLAIDTFETLKKEFFEFLDNTSNPYFFILQPFYKFGAGVSYRKVPYKADNMSGSQNIDIAGDYAIYKINKNT